jgi:hypothetical protein
MKAYAVSIIVAFLAVGCASSLEKRCPHPVIAEFTVQGVPVGPVETREVAEKVAWAYFRAFDDSGGIQFRAERVDRWIFAAQAGDFAAVPVAEIVVSKDGSFLSQSGVAPLVRMISGKWLYDKREEREFLWEFDSENPAIKQPNQALEHNDPSRHASCCAPVAPTGIVAHL